MGGIAWRVRENIFSWSAGDKDYRVSGLVQWCLDVFFITLNHALSLLYSLVLSFL